MSIIIEKIKEIPNLYQSQGASEIEIKQAESKLGLMFSTEFKDYLMSYGQISFLNTEWMGLKSDDFCDVVNMTLEARQNYSDFPNDKYIVENLHFDDHIVLADSVGKVYIWKNGEESLIHKTLGDYLDECIER